MYTNLENNCKDLFIKKLYNEYLIAISCISYYAMHMLCVITIMFEFIPDDSW